MSINVSKEKREDLLDKIKQIRFFIASAPQDENTGNLLSYLLPLVNICKVPVWKEAVPKMYGFIKLHQPGGRKIGSRMLFSLSRVLPAFNSSINHTAISSTFFSFSELRSSFPLRIRYF